MRKRTWPNVINYEGVNGFGTIEMEPERDMTATYDVQIFLLFVSFRRTYGSHTQGAMRNAIKKNYNW